MFIPFLFSLFLNDLEDFFIHENVPGLNSISDELDSRLDIFMKLFIILYADDTVLNLYYSKASYTIKHRTIQYQMIFKNQQKHRIISFSYFSKFQKNNEVQTYNQLLSIQIGICIDQQAISLLNYTKNYLT
jgi:hypothetical protein